MFFYNESDSEVSQVVPGTTDEYFSNVSLLLNMDSDSSDSSVHQHTVTTGGNFTVSNSEFKYGGGSGYFDGNINTGLSFSPSDSFDLRNVDWTMEAWIKPDGDYSDFRMILSKRDYDGDSDYQVYLSQDSGLINFYEHSNPSAGAITTNVAPTVNQWNHVAVVRKDGVVTIYLNGEAAASATRNIGNHRNYSLGIGNISVLNRHPFSGHIDDVRITKGIARYTANFTPPTEAHPAS